MEGLQHVRVSAFSLPPRLRLVLRRLRAVAVPVRRYLMGSGARHVDLQNPIARSAWQRALAGAGSGVELWRLFDGARGLPDTTRLELIARYAPCDDPDVVRAVLCRAPATGPTWAHRFRGAPHARGLPALIDWAVDALIGPGAVSVAPARAAVETLIVLSAVGALPANGAPTDALCAGYCVPRTPRALVSRKAMLDVLLWHDALSAAHLAALMLAPTAPETHVVRMAYHPAATGALVCELLAARGTPTLLQSLAHIPALAEDALFRTWAFASPWCDVAVRARLCLATPALEFAPAWRALLAVDAPAASRVLMDVSPTLRGAVAADDVLPLLASADPVIRARTLAVMADVGPSLIGGSDRTRITV